MKLDGARILDHHLPYVKSVLSFLTRGHRPLGAKVSDRKKERESERDRGQYPGPPAPLRRVREKKRERIRERNPEPTAPKLVLSFFLTRGHKPLGAKVSDRERER